MVLTVQLARSSCVEWKSELPRVGRKCESPIFILDGCKMQFRLIGCWNEELKCESWELSLKKISTLMKTVSLTGFTAKKEKRNNNNSKPYQQECNPSPSARSVLAHIENKIGELKLAYCGEIYFESEGYNRFFEFNRNSHLNKYGITNDKISMYFVFDSDSKSSQSIMEEAVVTNSEYNEGTSDHMCLQGLSKDMEKLLGKSEHSDLVLKCDDRRFCVNKEILSIRSPVLSAMFKDDICKGESNEVEFTDIQTSVLEQFLKYIYTGTVENLNLDSAFTLYEAGEKFEVPLLKRKCSSFIANKISTSNVCQILLLADKFQDSELLEATISFAVSRERFLGSLIWRTFTEEYPTIAVKVFLKFHE